MNSIESNLFLSTDADVANELALTLNELADTNKLLLITFKDAVVELTLAVNVFSDAVVSSNEFVTELTLALNVFKEVIEDAWELLVDNAVEANVLNALALSTKLLALTSKLFISPSEEVVYAIKVLAVDCNAVIDANDEVANAFNPLTLVEVPQFTDELSISSNLDSWFDAEVLNEEAEVNKLEVAIRMLSIVVLLLWVYKFNDCVAALNKVNLVLAEDALLNNADDDIPNDDADIT